MSLTTTEITSVVQDIGPLLSGGEIVRIDQLEKYRFVFHIRKDACRYWLQIVVHPQFSRLHLLSGRPKTNKPETGFCNVLRQHLTASPIVSLQQIENDRVVVLESIERDALLNKRCVRLIVELVGRGSNLILVDSQDKVLGALFPEKSRRRIIVPGAGFVSLPPPPQNVRSGQNRFSQYAGADDILALSRAIDQHYEYVEERAEFAERLKEFQKRMDKEKLKLENLHNNLESDLRDADKAEILKKEGELLKIALPHMKKGQKSVTVQDYFSKEFNEKRIDLDPYLTPQENMQNRFKHYKQLRSSVDPLTKKLEHTEKKLHELEQIENLLNNIVCLRELQEIENTEAVKKLLSDNKADRLPHKDQNAEKGPRRFCSSDGIEILVARNRRQNHRLTFSIARGNDYWMHVLGHPGAHVVIKHRQNCELPRSTLVEAAHLAIYYSKLQGAGFVRVLYTQCKHVKSVKGSDEGVVHCSRESTLGVRFSKKRIQKILNRD